jgi:hypothetical protein
MPPLLAEQGMMLSGPGNGPSGPPGGPIMLSEPSKGSMTTSRTGQIWACWNFMQGSTEGPGQAGAQHSTSSTSSKGEELSASEYGFARACLFGPIGLSGCVQHTVGF